jgi:UDP-3-O-[3-hydroxymyristoyl] glucosamine N-acyltransferase
VPYTLGELARHVKGRVIGDESCVIDGVATLSGATPGKISFLTNAAYRKQLAQSKASAVILQEDDLQQCQVNALVVNNPHAAYARIASLLYPRDTSLSGIEQSAQIAESANIHQSAWIGHNAIVGENAQVAAGVQIGPGCVIEHDVHIGKQATILANVTICHDTRIGESALIHPGVVIGSDGFGQADDNGTWVKVPQIGNVIIGRDVEIGANTTIDRGAIEDTIIGDNVKLDNQIQIAHNVQIGAHTVISGCSAIAGSTRIGKHCAIGGAVGIVGHLTIADNVFITAMSLVTKSIKKPGVYSSGTPLDTNKSWHRNSVRFKQLDTIAKRLKQLEHQVELLNEKE